MKRIILVLTVALLMVAMLAASALPAMAAASGPTCPNPGTTIAHATVPEGNPAHGHIPCP